MFLCTLLGKIFLRAIFISCLKDKYFVKIWKFFSGVDSAVSGMMERELPGCLIGQIYHTAEQIYHKYWTNISHGGTNISQILDKYITRRNKYITNIGQIYHTAERPTFSLGHHPFLFILQIPILICWSVGKQQ